MPFSARTAPVTSATHRDRRALVHHGAPSASRPDTRLRCPRPARPPARSSSCRDVRPDAVEPAVDGSDHNGGHHPAPDGSTLPVGTWPEANRAAPHNSMAATTQDSSQPLTTSSPRLDQPSTNPAPNPRVHGVAAAVGHGLGGAAWITAPAVATTAPNARACHQRGRIMSGRDANPPAIAAHTAMS